MRKITFEVPAEIIGDFADKLTELGMENQIIGKNEYDEIEIEVLYERNESQCVDILEEYLDELKEKLLEEAEDDEEEEEDEEDK